MVSIIHEDEGNTVFESKASAECSALERQAETRRLITKMLHDAGYQEAGALTGGLVYVPVVDRSGFVKRVSVSDLSLYRARVIHIASGDKRTAVFNVETKDSGIDVKMKIYE